MSDSTPPNQNPQTQNPPPTSANAMAETEKSPPQSETPTTTTAAAAPAAPAPAPAAEKHSNVSFSIWPPTERTREAVRNRLIETLSTPSILSKRYGTVSREEAVGAAKLIEQEAFEVAGKAATKDDDGIEILQVYSKEISKRMLDTVKARSGDSVAAPAAPPVNDAPGKPEEVDAGSTAPPQSEKTESVSGD